MNMAICGSRRGCFCLPLRSLGVVTVFKLCLDVSFMTYHFYNLNSLLGLYTVSLNGSFCTNDEGDVSCTPFPTFWIVVPPVLKILIDIVFDVLLIVGCYKKYVELLRISFAYSVFMAVFHVFAFCSEVSLQLDFEKLIFAYKIFFLSVMPYVAMVSDWEIGMASAVLAWLLWISYVGLLSFYLPYLVRTEIQKLETKYELKTNADAACQQQGILYAPRKLGLVKMLVVKKAVVVLLVMYLAYFAIGMGKLQIPMGYIIMMLILTIPLLMVDAAYNIVLYRGHNKDQGLLRMYYRYSMKVRLLNVVTALAVKYYEFAFCILQEKEWCILLFNFHIYFMLWMVYVVVHFYVEMLAESEIAKMESSNFIQLARPSV